MMRMLVNCSNCRTPLQLPPGAPSIRCAVCQQLTFIADPRSVPYGYGPPPPNYCPPPLPSAPPYMPPPLPSAPPYMPPPPPAGAPPSPFGRKRAVICGISYRNTDHELQGCINDANCMKYLLTKRFNFPESSIIMLTEDETDPYKIPTKRNIQMAMYWLVQGCQPGDSLVFHYSGHGSQQRDTDGDEADGMDETICPLDFKTQGMIVDDEINAVLVKPLPFGVRLHAIIDACHSGTVLDLPYLCRMGRSGQYVWEDHRPRTSAWKGTSGGEAISFSGCDDNQTSADTSALSRVTSTGAMTFCFIQAVESGAGTTYGNLLTAMRTQIRNVDTKTSSDALTTILEMLILGGSGGGGGGLTQEPQLTANEMFDVYTKPFYL